jgi:predicted DNA binding CopG/RHH family protein
LLTKKGYRPNLKPSSRSISIRLPEYIINKVKVEANKLDVPYQSLIKQYIAKEVLKKENVYKPVD